MPLLINTQLQLGVGDSDLDRNRFNGFVAVVDVENLLKQFGDTGVLCKSPL